MFASDNLSSSAYATEEILHVLIPLVGLAAFSLVVPITIAMVVVLVTFLPILAAYYLTRDGDTVSGMGK